MVYRISGQLPGAGALEGALAALGAATVAAVLCLCLDTGLRHRLCSLLVGADSPRDVSTALVEQVVDGDTLRLSGGATVRLLGLDAPETVNPDLASAQPLGAEASARLRGLLEGRHVLLERDVTDADHYGRLLRHVWLGRALVAEIMIVEGLAHSQSVPPDTRHAERLASAEREARDAGRGIWGLARPTPLPVFAEEGW